MTASVNHDYPLDNSMLVVDASNDPIEGATIRIFEYTAFQAGEVDTWVAETISDVDGKWVDPVILEDGQTWIVHFEKYSSYGPVHVEITT